MLTISCIRSCVGKLDKQAEFITMRGLTVGWVFSKDPWLKTCITRYTKGVSSVNARIPANLETVPTYAWLLHRNTKRVNSPWPTSTSILLFSRPSCLYSWWTWIAQCRDWPGRRSDPPLLFSAYQHCHTVRFRYQHSCAAYTGFLFDWWQTHVVEEPPLRHFLVLL